MIRTTAILLLPLVLFCTGCTNLYLAHYQGKQFRIHQRGETSHGGP